MDNNTPLRILNNSAKHLVRDSKRLEEPFLKESPHRRELDTEKSDREFLRGDYVSMTLRRRYIWLRSEDEVVTLATRVDRIQTRRIACDSDNVLSSVSKRQLHYLRLIESQQFMVSKEHYGILTTGFGVSRSISWVRPYRMERST